MQILIWGDNMKRQISICIFITVIAIILALLYTTIHNQNNDKKEEHLVEVTEQENSEKTPSVTISQEYTTYYFYAKDDEGRVSIYDMKSQTLYMETGIETNMLPESVQQELESGIYFKDEMELYDFLESYSS